MVKRSLLPLAVFLMCAPAHGDPQVSAEELPRLKPLEPKEAAASFVLRPGFRIELAAAEPEVASPVAMCFDQFGALFVAEMRDYPTPERRAQKLGRVRKLVDRDGDGRFETSTIFMKDLAWPTGVFCTPAGVLVLASPDMIYAEDTNLDGVADAQQVVATGFGSGRDKLNVQALPNSLKWGPDGRIWGAAAGNGGTINQNGKPVRLDGSDFSMTPSGEDIRAETGTAQYGLTFDASGRRFVCSNSRHLIWVAWERWQGGNLEPLPPALIDIPNDGAAAPVYRISPEEPWRVVRTRWRASGLVPGIVEGGGRVSGYFTSACGVHIYQGDAFPPEYRGNAFIGDVGSNLVHRKIIREVGDSLVAERAADEKDREFLASKDNWFRPVAFADGPDGALYIADMYREVIEHPDSLPESIKKHLDLASGAERGRIWRIVPEGFKRSIRGYTVNLEPMIEMLHDPNRWHRETAQKLLYRLAGRLIGYEPPFLAISQANGELAVGQIARDYGSGNSEAQRTALRWLSKAIDSDSATAIQFRAKVVKSEDPFVLIELAGTLQELKTGDRVTLLADIWRAGAKFPRVRQATLLAVKDGGEALQVIGKTEEMDERLWRLAGRSRDAEVRNAAMQQLSDKAKTMPEKAATAWAAFGAKPVDETLLAWARANATGANAVALLLLSGSETGLLQSVFLNQHAPAEARRAALSGLGVEQVAPICSEWTKVAAALRPEFVEWCLKKKDATAALVQALEAGNLAPSEISVAQANRLRASADKTVREAALKILGPPPPDRQETIARLQGALTRSGDAGRGAVLFQLRCITCHRDGEAGIAMGPDRITFRSQGKPSLLLNVIDPNREVAPAYAAVLAETTKAEAVSGLLVAEDAGSVSIKTLTGQQTRIAREELKKLERLNRSLMPEGLEAGMSDQDVADLLEFLVK